jgi:positive regulator of sigma E activity
MDWQTTDAIIVTLNRDPEPSAATTVAQIVLGSLGLAGFMFLASVVLGGLVAFLLVRRHRRHPPEADHLPSVSPFVQGPPSAPAP